jgi:hypothetical protein
MKKPDPLKPSSEVLCRLGSIIAHYIEFHSPDGREIDKAEAEAKTADPMVQEWLDGMRKLALLPVPRVKRR